MSTPVINVDQDLLLTLYTTPSSLNIDQDLLLVLSRRFAGQVYISGGGFQDPSGNPLALGTLSVRLSQDVGIGGIQLCAGRWVTLDLDSNGNVTGNPLLWTGTYEFVAYSAQGQPVWSGQLAIPDISYFSLTP